MDSEFIVVWCPTVGEDSESRVEYVVSGGVGAIEIIYMIGVAEDHLYLTCFGFPDCFDV